MEIFEYFSNMGHPGRIITPDNSAGFKAYSSTGTFRMISTYTVIASIAWRDIDE